MSAVALDAGRTGWSPQWETNVYARGRHLNLYPHHAVVGFVLRHYGAAADRAAVRVLELGFGAGNNLWFAAREGLSVAGVEASPTAVEFARRRFAEDDLAGDLRVGSFAALDWDDASIDLVIDRHSLTHTRRATIVQALDEARRVLRPGGRLLSMMYSDGHPGRGFGEHLGDNDYSAFSGGYFAGLGVTHFADRAEIVELFGARFEITGLLHTREDDMSDGVTPANAIWRVECIKR